MADQNLETRLTATNEDEAREMVRRACEQNGWTLEADGDDGAVSLSDEEIEKVVGGTGSERSEPKVGDIVKVSGGLYCSSYGEGYSGQINGVYFIQKYIPGRDTPYLLYNKVGWVKASAVRPPRG